MSKPHGSVRKTKPTMMDVARKAGVSQTTVSFVLNGSPGAKLSDATRQRVRQAADELGYTLVRRTTVKNPANQSVIVFIVDEIASDPWMALAFAGARERALEFGYNIYLAVSNGNPDTEEAIIQQMDQQPMLGIIYGTILTRLVEPPAVIYRHPTVLLNCYDADRRLHSVIPGDRLGGRTATEHLVEAGRRRIGFINGQDGVDASRERLKGYRQALASNDIPFKKDLIRSGNWEPTSGYEHTKSLLAMDNPPDAIFCGNDLMAVGCMDALREVGMSVPGDISVIGFDDRDIAQHTHPPLTTLILPHSEMGSSAAETLIEMRGGHNIAPVQIKVDCTLIDRESV